MAHSTAPRDAVTEYFRAFNAHAFDEAIASFAPMVSNHGRSVPRERLKIVWNDILTRFPDVQMAIDDICSDGDTVVTRIMYSGTHKGVGRLPVDSGFMVGVAPTGKSFAVQHIHWFKLENGLIAAHWACRDDVGMLVQLGILPPPAQ